MTQAFFELAALQIRSSILPLSAVILFILSGRLYRRWQDVAGASAFLFITNLACLALFFWDTIRENPKSILIFGLVIVLQYLILIATRKSLDKRWQIPFFAPLTFLFLVKAFPSPLAHHGISTAAFIGVSYLSLRLSYLVVELSNQRVPFPSFFEYFTFAFFLPTLNVGPINPYAQFKERPTYSKEQLWDAFVRIFIGLGKYQVLGVVFLRLTFAKLWGDEYRHPSIDFLVSSMAQFLYLYCNFAGFCDIMIGIAILSGFSVKENFNSPFKARNIKDFWNRWHITLSEYMRDIVFTPLSKSLVSKWGPKRINEVIAVTVTVVFLLIGIWHGVGWNFVLYGLMNAVGLVAVQYYTHFLRSRFPTRFKWYNQNRYIYFGARLVTFIYLSLSQALFANSISELGSLFKQIVS